MTRTSLTIVLALLASLPLSAQGGARNPSKQQEPYPTLKRSELVVAYYRVKNSRSVDLDDLVKAATSVYGRSFLVDDLPRSSRPMRNIFTVGHSIAVFETNDRAKAIIKELPRLEEAAMPSVSPRRSPTRESLVTEWIKLEYVEAKSTQRVLMAYQRVVPSAAQADAGPSVPNITVHPGSNSLLVRETKENLIGIRRILAEIDVPASPQASSPAVTVVCHVVRAATAPVEQQNPLPAEFTRNLTQLVGWKHFGVQGTSIVRASAHSKEVTSTIAVGEGGTATLGLSNLGFDQPSDTLKLGKVHFQMRTTDPDDRSPVLHSFETSTDVTLGQYTVIGAFGKTPYFLVIRAAVLR